MLGWTAPLDSGCLPILNYIIQKNGIDLATVVSPSQSSFTDNISTGGSIGT